MTQKRGKMKRADHLVAARIARRKQGGGYESSRASKTPISREEYTDDEEITCEVSAECAAMLDRIGPTREAAIMTILKRFSGSGVRSRKP
jgi:hypothetical protein